MMSTTTWIRPLVRRGAALLLLMTAIGFSPVSPTVSAAGDLGAGGEYFPLTPARVFDSTNDVAGGRVDGNGSVTVPVLGVEGVPETGVLAVAVNVTIAGAPSKGYASVSPSGQSTDASLINFQYTGHTVPNFTIVGVGDDGAITIKLTSQGAGSARVIVDVFGFVATSSFTGDGAISEADGARLNPVTPARLLDTRSTAPIGARQSIEVPILGELSVPDRPSVTAVVLNMTGVNARNTVSTYLTISPTRVPSGEAHALSSNGNYPPRVNKANLVIVPVNEQGSVFVYNRNGSINVVLDVVGYLETGGAGDSTTGRIVPLESPFRSFDTRQAEFGNARLGFSQWEDWSFADFAGSVRLNGVPVGAQGALFGNLTAVGLQRNYAAEPVTSFMTMNPVYQDGTYPTSVNNSNLNFDEGGAVANSAIVTYGTKAGDQYMTSAYNSNGRTHYLLDVYAVILD